MLVQCGYLKRTINPKKKSTFLYSETEAVTDYRRSKNQENMAMALKEKMDAVQGNIMKKHIEVNFISEFSVHDKFHRTLILSGFCLLKIAKISLN